MDLKHLEYFKTIVESNFNLSIAANKLHITQPSLSILITNWEKSYSIKLFEKHKNNFVKLTSDGEFVYNHALQILTIHNDFIYNLDKKSKNFSGTVKIGIPPIVISLLFTNCILEFMSNYPNIKLEIIELGANELERMLANNEIDIAILVDPVFNTKFRQTKLFEDQLVVIFSNTSNLNKLEKISVHDMAKENLVILSEEFVLHDVIKKMFSDKYIVPPIIFTTSQWDLIVDIISKTNYYSILPGPIINKLDLSINQYKYLDFKAPWIINLVTNNSSIKTTAIRFFEEYLTSYFNLHKTPYIDKQPKPINIV